MVPSACVAVESFPLSANGKVDRQALAALELRGARRGGRARCRRARAAERTIVGVLQEVLQIDVVGVNENVFELGLTSLLAVPCASAC